MSEIMKTTAEPKLQFTLVDMMQNPELYLSELEKLFRALNDKRPTVADDFCECSRFNLIERAKIMLELQPEKSASELAFMLANEIFNGLREKAVKKAN
jgi:hypothetical protein